VYALGAQLYRSDDAGRSWQNLTTFERESVIGVRQNSLAILPGDPDQLVVANDFGAWKSMDGGLSWSGLNQYLPNLPRSHILATPGGGRSVRIAVEGFGSLELSPGGNISPWHPLSAAPGADLEQRARRAWSASLGASITAVATAGDTVYAGSADGWVRVSLDAGRSFQPPGPHPAGGPVEAIWLHPNYPRIALVAAGGHIWRTTNNGNFWDDLSANLPEAPTHAVTADPATGAVYAATDKGVYLAFEDLLNPAPAANWTVLTTALPAVPATDVRLDPGANQLYVALENYGIYAAPAPHRSLAPSIVNAADFSARPAAPGSLVSVMGARVNSANAGGLSLPVLAASASQSQLQVPFEATASMLSLALDTAAGRVTVPLAVQPVAPAIFVGSDGAPMLVDADTGLMLGVHNSAHSNSRIQVIATGLGKVRPEWPTGVAAPQNPPAVAATVRAFVDRQPVQVTRATLAPGYIGLYFVEVQLPALVNSGPAELYLSADGQESNRVQLILEP
jgi:uncharacterized protein (TIGR03437 family)